MNIFAKSRLFVISLSISVLATSCATFRPMPTHGGGKRFDEEQLAVSASIRHATAKMDFSKMKKRKVAIEITSLPTSGGAEEVEYPGLEQIYGYNLKPKLLTKKNITREDIQYLETALISQLRFSGYQVTSPEDSDLYLIVLVDALGTNHSRKDYGMVYRDNLGASCEMTYYVVDSKTQKLIARAKSCASYSEYSEFNIRFTPFSYKSKILIDALDSSVPLPVVRKLHFAEEAVPAHIEMLQLKLKEKVKKKKKKEKGKNKGKGRKGKKRGASGEQIEITPPKEIVPPLDLGPDDGLKIPGIDNPAENKATKIKALLKRIRQGIRKGNLDDAQKAIDELKTLNPKAQGIKKFQPQIDQARKDAEQQNDEPAPKDTPAKPKEPNSNTDTPEN